MSERLGLNEEQAKALKEWWLEAQFHLGREGRTRVIGSWEERSVVLSDALRPLFEPWRVEAVGAGECVVNPRGDMRITVTGIGFHEMHKKIAAWLNAAERGEPS